MKRPLCIVSSGLMQPTSGPPMLLVATVPVAVTSTGSFESVFGDEFLFSAAAGFSQ